MFVLHLALFTGLRRLIYWWSCLGLMWLRLSTNCENKGCSCMCRMVERKF